MNDIEYLRDKLLPIDILIKDKYRNQCNLSNYIKPHKSLKNVNYVTWKLVQDYEETANDYIVYLIQHERTHGYLYFLRKQQMLIPLTINYNADLIVDPANNEDIRNKIDDIAAKFGCVNSKMYDITRLELIYFFTLLVNPNLNWITLDYLIRGNRFHSYLLGAPNRKVN